MRAMTKQEMALRAGVSVRTLIRWCRPYEAELQRMGMRPNMKLMPPHVVQFLVDRLCIDVD
ncbi:MAG: hypothetical protein K2K03_10115 [Prevotella sp.]|nr:hypothetical protein [Prevotella sp.]